MINVDFKITTWERVSVPAEKMDEVIEGIKNGTISDSSDLLNVIEGCLFEGVVDDSSSEQMSPDENGGMNTIDVLNEDGKLVFINT